MQVKVMKLRKDVKIPAKNNSSDAGFDLFYYGTDPLELVPDKQFMVPTGCCIVIPDGFFGLIRPRSGYSVKYGTDTLAGVVDAGYTGEVSVVMTVEHRLVLQPGDKVAQMLILPVPDAEIVEISALPDTLRGDDGYGSSGG